MCRLLRGVQVCVRGAEGVVTEEAVEAGLVLKMEWCSPLHLWLKSIAKRSAEARGSQEENVADEDVAEAHDSQIPQAELWSRISVLDLQP